MSEFLEKETVQIFPKRLGWPFYLTWIMVTLLSFPVAFLLDFAILRVLINFVGAVIYVDGVRHITEDYLLMYLLVPTVGLLMGAFQYGLLRQYLPRMGWWVIVTIGGWLLGMLLMAFLGWLNWTDAFLTNIDLVFIVFGLSISVGQWLLLRRRLPRAGWWIVANLVGWGLLGFVTPRDSVGQFGLFTMGFFPACATGAAIALLINQVRPAGQREA